MPDSSSRRNDNAIYCSRNQPLTGDTLITSLSFEDDSTLVYPNRFQRALSIFLGTQADFNHYIMASVSGNKKLEMLTYSWNNNPDPLLTLHTGHWYRYEIIASVCDLGTWHFNSRYSEFKRWNFQR